MRKEDSQRSFNGGTNSSSKGVVVSGATGKQFQVSGLTPGTTTDAQAAGLYIDSRKPKRPLGSESYKLDEPNSDLNEFMTNYRLPPRTNGANQ